MGTGTKYIAFIEALRLKKARALALFLLLPTGRVHRSEKIIDLLWRDADSKKSQASLRQTVRHMRSVSQNLVTLPLITGSGSVSVALPKDWSLVADLAAGLQDKDEFDNASVSAQSFLDNLDLLLGLSESFDSWIEISRAHALTQFQKTLEAIVDSRAPKHAHHAAEFLIKIEPHNEFATRFVMVHHWSNKSATRAVEVYNRLYAYLDHEFDQEPEVETMELLAAIKIDPEGGSSNQRSPAPQTKVTLSVQGFESSTVEKRDASFQAVLVSDFRMRLSRFREWQVVDSEPLHDDFLLITMQLFSVGGKYRLAVDATRPKQRELVWSELIDDPQSDWQDKVRLLVFNVANALRVVVADRSDSDNRAFLYDRWLRSLALIGTWSGPDEDEAVDLLSGITSEAPDFGPAHAELAGIYNIRHILRPGTFQADNIKDMALNHALEAVAIDPLDTRAHRVLAWCYCHKAEFDLAEFHFDQSLLLNSQNPHTMASSALGFAFCDNRERAQELISEVARIPGTMEPFHLIYLAASNYLMGAYEAALHQCEIGSGLMSTVGGWHSAALLKLGRNDDAQMRLAQYCTETADIWCGKHTATPRNVVDWFVSCFPLRNLSAREDLRSTLDLINLSDEKSISSIAHVGDVNTNSAMEC